MTIRPPRTGTVAAAAAFIALASLGGIVGRDTEGTYPVSASFPRAIALFPGSTVRVLGVEVGRITSVVPAGDRVNVGMDIRSDIKIPHDARAIIVPISLISDRYVQLEPVYRGGRALQPGDAIPLDRGIVPAELDDLLATLQDFLSAIEPGTADAPGALGQLVTNADAALDGKGVELGSTVEGLATVLDTLGRSAGSLDGIIVGLDRVMQSLARRDSAIVATNRGLVSVFSLLAEEREALESGVANLADAVDAVGSLVADHRDTLDADLITLREITRLVVANEAGLVRNLRWFPVLEQGVINAYEEELRRFIVRDNPEEHAEG